MRSSADALHRDPRRYVAEALGTAIPVLVGPGAAMVSASTHAVPIGVEGPITGAVPVLTATPCE